ncbi:MAG: hypothetical protein ABH883_06335, partial [Candidatus Omnitrophota bacterium]
MKSNKSITLVLCSIFLVNSVIVPGTFAESAEIAGSQVRAAYPPVRDRVHDWINDIRREMDLLSPEKVGVPDNLAEVQDKYFTRGEKFVIHIQEAHCQYDCQKAIAGILSRLIKGYGLRTVNLEGGEGSYDLEVFAKIEDSGARVKTADRMLREGEINAAEYYSVNDPGKIELNGMEDTELYLKNLKAYRDFLSEETAVKKSLAAIDAAIALAKKQVYRSALFEFEEKVNAYYSSDMPLRGLLEYLSEISKDILTQEGYPGITAIAGVFSLEKDIDFASAEKEREKLLKRLLEKASYNDRLELAEISDRILKKEITEKDLYDYLIAKSRELDAGLSDITEIFKYREYVTRFSDLDIDLVYGELDSLIKEIKESLFETRAQKELDSLGERVRMLSKLFAFKLTREEFGRYVNEEDKYDIRSIIRALSSPGVLTDSEADALEAERNGIRDFYAYSFRRDEEFLRNIKYDERPGLGKTAVLITGGFHGENLRALMKKQGISYISLMPKYSDSGVPCLYFKKLSGEVNAEIKALMAETSGMAVYSVFCEKAVRVYSLNEVEMRKAWVEITGAVLAGKKSFEAAGLFCAVDMPEGEMDEIGSLNGHVLYIARENIREKALSAPAEKIFIQ